MQVDRLTDQLRQMAADFVIKPDARIREVEMADRLGVSRTPLREALNRLVAEGFLTFQSGQGFSCRSLTPRQIVELYEARAAVECEALRHAVTRADDAAIAALGAFLDTTEPDYAPGTDPIRLLERDEAFHMRLAELSGNTELVRMLENLNGRIRYVRMSDLKTLWENQGGPPHRRIYERLQARDAEGAVQALRDHIEMRLDKATDAVRVAFSRIYVDGET